MGHSFGLLDFVHFLIVTDLQCVIRRRQIWYLLQYSSPSLPRAQTLPRPHPLSRVASGILLVRKQKSYHRRVRRKGLSSMLVN